LELGLGFYLGIITILTITIVGALAPIIAPYRPEDLFTPLSPPSPSHLLGTDDVGHDVLTHLIYGARTSVIVGGLTATFSTLIGMIAALISGYYPKWDPLISRALDFFLSIPRLPLIVILAAFLRPDIWLVISILSFFGWAITARVIRPFIMQERSKSYIERLKCIGARDSYIMIRHLLPATFPLAAAQFILEAGHAVLAEASIGFFGLEDPTTLSWGMEIQHSLQRSIIFLTNKWTWTIGPPSVALIIFLLGMTLMAMDLEKNLNPRLRVRLW